MEKNKICTFCDVTKLCEYLSISKEIGNEELITAPKFRFSPLFGLVWLLYTKQAQYNEGCAKLNYLLPEV